MNIIKDIFSVIGIIIYVLTIILWFVIAFPFSLYPRLKHGDWPEWYIHPKIMY